MRFQGQYYDQESGLHYNRHRYYNPNTGRYLTPDPIKLAGGLNSYQYVPSPTGWVDPLGLSCVPGDCPSAPAEINADTLDQSTIDAVLSFEKGNRPEPEIYLSKTYRDAHAALFRNGTARIQSTAPTGIIGRTETWVLPKSVAELAIDKADGNVSKLEFYLGLDKGYLGDKPVLVLIANPNNYRIPSGNEYGANYFLRPGGFTSLGELPEAIIDPTKAN